LPCRTGHAEAGRPVALPSMISRGADKVEVPARPLERAPRLGQAGWTPPDGWRKETVVGGTDDREFAAFVRDAGPGLATAAWVLTGHAPTAESLAGEALGRLHPRWAQVRHRPVTAAEQELVDV